MGIPRGGRRGRNRVRPVRPRPLARTDPGLRVLGGGEPAVPRDRPRVVAGERTPPDPCFLDRGGPTRAGRGPSFPRVPETPSGVPGPDQSPPGGDRLPRTRAR